MKKSSLYKIVTLGILLLFALFAFAKQEKVIQIFKNGKVIQEFSISDIDYIEVNERLAVPESIPDDEIWYVMADGSIYDVTQTTQVHGVKPFDREILSNEYFEDHGIIKFDGPVKRINKYAFGTGATLDILAVYLPDCIEYLGEGAFFNSAISTFQVPDNLKEVDVNPFYNCTNLSSFIGSHTSEDGRCLVLNDNIYAFAPKGVTDYVTPNGIKRIEYNAFYNCNELETIKLSEGLEFIQMDAFAQCLNLKSVIFPSSLKSLGTYSFRQCTAIEGFYGNDKFHTSDNQCLKCYVDYGEKSGDWLITFAGKNLQEYAIPEGIVGIENYAFSSKMNLKEVSLPNSLKFVAGLSFYDCPNIESVNGYHTSSDNKCIVIDGELLAFVAKSGITSYKIPDEITRIGYNAFSECALEEISMGDNVSEIDGYAFASNPSLKSLTLSASIRHFGNYNPILGDYNLESVYMRAPVPPSYSDYQMNEFPNLKIFVPEESYDLYMSTPQWNDFKQFFVAHNYDNLDIEKYLPDYYYSTDYSQNGVVKQLLTATEGNGIDIVLMGDAFSDRLIADGTYHNVMQALVDNLFDEEPYRSFKDMFNVYYVNVVSHSEGYENGTTALDSFFGEGTFVGGNDARCVKYALNAISEDRMDDALIVVAMNVDEYAGTCFMYYPENYTGDYGTGLSIAYFPISSDTETFKGLIHHEALGHGFAKLADEYAYEFMGAVPYDYVSQTMHQQNDWGWWKNIDFTNDLANVRWNYFLNDSRYANEGLGVYEGGLTYWSGVWRPTENSIMRYNTGGFNAPSREAIYYRIHKLAYGDDWTYNYEDFVDYDEINRTEQATRRLRTPSTHKREPLHAPVVIKKSWREAKTNK